MTKKIMLRNYSNSNLMSGFTGLLTRTLYIYICLLISLHSKKNVNQNSNKCEN